MSSNGFREQVLQIEQAIKHVNSYRDKIRKDAADMKAKTYTRMSHTVGLQDQEYQSLVVKEEALQRCIARLSHTLGVLKGFLTVRLDETSLHMCIAMLNLGLGVIKDCLPVCLDETSQDLEDAVEMLKKIQLTSEQSPYDFSKIYDVIPAESDHNKSTDNESSFSLLKIADFPDSISESLSRQLEEYKDVRHENKSVYLVKQVQASNSDVKYGIPQLSNRVEDWLHKSATTNAESKDSVFARFRPAPYPDLLFKPAGRFSERVPGTRTPVGTSSCEARVRGHRSSPQCVRENLKIWLSRDSGSPSRFSNPSSVILPDIEKWLHESRLQQSNNLKELKYKDFSQHLSKAPSSWLQTPACLKPALKPGSQDGVASSSDMKEDTECWLQDQKKPNAAEQIEKKSNSSLKRSCGANSSCCGKTCGIKEEKWLSPASKASATLLQLKDVCRANELCRNLSECVSQPSCLTSWIADNSAVKNRPVSVELVQSVSSSLNKWLSPAAQKQIDCSSLRKDEKVTSDLFRHIPPANDAMWLMKSSSSTDSAAAPHLARFKVDKEETNLWLQKTSSCSLAEVTPSGEGLRPSSTSSDPDWLIVTAEDKSRHQELKESEGWSICSDSHSISTDQLDKNLAVADEYLSKWLMQQ